MPLPWVPEVFLAQFPVSVISPLRPARKTSGAERHAVTLAERELRHAVTLGAIGFSCAVSGVGHISIVTSAKRSEEFSSATREKKTSGTVVPRVSLCRNYC